MICLVHVIIVTVMFVLNFVHCEITACVSGNKQSLILTYLILSDAEIPGVLPSHRLTSACAAHFASCFVYDCKTTLHS